MINEQEKVTAEVPTVRDVGYTCQVDGKKTLISQFFVSCFGNICVCWCCYEYAWWLGKDDGLLGKG